MTEDRDRRTERPTEARRHRARAEGRVATSHHLVAVSGLLGGLLALVVGGGALLRGLCDMAASGLGAAGRTEPLSPGRVQALAAELLGGTAAALVPLGAALFCAAALAGLLQTRGLFRPATLRPRAGRISPVAGVRRLVSAQAAVRGLVVVLECGVLAAVLARGADLLLARDGALRAGSLLGADPVVGAGRVAGELGRLGLQAAAGLFAVACLHWIAERALLERDLRMTPEEVRSEAREQEARPEVRRRQARIGRQRAAGATGGAP